MLQYLIILLDDTATSICHYECTKKEQNLIKIDNLKAGIMFGMKENLMIQFVYPDYELPQNYKDLIDTIDSSTITSSSCKDTKLRNNADIVVFHDWNSMEQYNFKEKGVYIIRTTKSELFKHYLLLQPILEKVTRLNVVITDIEIFKDNDFHTYKKILATLSEKIKRLYLKGKSPQLNLLTDRMMLKQMNNCNAGFNSITLAPDGKFYICPAFYYHRKHEYCAINDVGDLENGLNIKNPQLYKLSYAPLCRECDAYHCKRCVWLNRQMTYEVNTPSHEQCVISHLERNASRELLYEIRKNISFLPEVIIDEISYLDPFDVKKD